MKHQWLVYAIVALLSAGAGVAIAGVPSSESTNPTIVVLATTAAPVPEIAATAAPQSDTTLPPPTTTTESPTTTAPPETTTTLAAPVLPDRADIVVAVANGADIGGIAGATAAALEELGYVDVRATDGSDIVDLTVVYFTEGFEGSAERLAIDLDLDPSSIAPLILAPEIVGGLENEDLLVYLGADLS